MRPTLPKLIDRNTQHVFRPTLILLTQTPGPPGETAHKTAHRASIDDENIRTTGRPPASQVAATCGRGGRPTRMASPRARASATRDATQAYHACGLA